MLAAAALLLAAAAPAGSSPAGVYEIRQMEMAGGIELRADGHFRYALSYGAADEEAEGDWTSEGQAVQLTTNPAPKPPAFELLRDDPAPKGKLSLALEPPGFGWEGPIDAVVTVAGSDQTVRVRTAGDGRIEIPRNLTVTAIEPMVSIYGGRGAAIALTADRGHRLLLRFKPNDLGKAAFHGESLARDGDDLLLKRYETVIRFLRVRP
ncbi:MAG: hypothetical protein ACJ8EI_01950 [Sphingomicrobium sp.]